MPASLRKSAALSVVLLSLSTSLRWYVKRINASTASRQRTETSLSRKAYVSVKPSLSSERERTISGFIAMFADRVEEGEYGHADLLADYVFKFNQMTDAEFAVASSGLPPSL